MTMNDLIASVDLFRQSVAPLKETSKDSSKEKTEGKSQYVIESDTPVINFDEVMKKYVKKYARQCEQPSSVDALALLDNRLTFIEFKNGETQKKALWRKVESSLLIFCDLMKQHLPFTRKCLDFYVVCTQLSPDDNTHKARDGIESFVEEQDEFGLKRRFKGLYFREVYTYTKEEFAETAKRIQPVML